MLSDVTPILAILTVLYLGRLALTRPLERAKDRLEALEDLVNLHSAKLETAIARTNALEKVAIEAHDKAEEAHKLALETGAAMVAQDKRLSAAQQHLTLQVGSHLQRKGK